MYQRTSTRTWTPFHHPHKNAGKKALIKLISVYLFRFKRIVLFDTLLEKSERDKLKTDEQKEKEDKETDEKEKEKNEQKGCSNPGKGTS